MQLIKLLILSTAISGTVSHRILHLLRHLCGECRCTTSTQKLHSCIFLRSWKAAERQGEIAEIFRSMAFIMMPISMVDFALIMLMESHCIGIFEAAWVSERKVVRDRQSISGALSMIGEELPLVYIITVNGSDDAEDFVVDEMLIRNLPAVAIFSYGGKVEHKSEINSGGNINKDLFLAEYDRVRNVDSSQSKIELSLSNKSDISNLATPLTRTFPLETIVSLIFSNMRIQNDIRITGPDHDDNYMDRGASEALTLFLSGDKSSVGKSSVCLAILASLIRLGVDPSAIAYIKVTYEYSRPYSLPLLMHYLSPISVFLYDIFYCIRSL